MRLVVMITGVLLAGAMLSPAPGGAETGVSFYAGKAWTADASVTLEEGSDRLEFDRVSWSDESFTSPIYYGLRVTHWFGASTGWGAGLDFIHIKMFAGLEDTIMVTGSREGVPVSGRERLGDTFSSLAFSHGHNLLLATGFYRWVPEDAGSWHSRLRPYVGLGVGAAIPHVEVTLPGSSSDEYQLTGPAFQGLAGTEIAIIPRLRGILEYKLSYARIVADLNGGGSLRVNPWTHQLAFGLALIVLN